MIRPMLLRSLCILVLLASTDVLAEGLPLGSREYKLMLEPSKFAGNEVARTVDRFWETLKGVIDDSVGLDNGKSRAKKSFEAKPNERNILFRDIKLQDGRDCALDGIGYAFRERVDLEDGREDKSSRELTLKYRTPDLFLAAEAYSKAKKEKTKTKLEEDISPLIARMRRSPTDEVTVAQPRSMRSLFAVSTKNERVAAGEAFEVLGDLIDDYPTWKANFKKAKLSELSMNARLLPGPKIHELVFEGAKVDLDHDEDVKFALTLWYNRDDAGAPKPLTAEISFKYEMENGEVDVDVARRALRLFLAMQAHLGDWSNPKQATKTSLALPEACQ
jgi:hypothetical protein